MTESDAQRASTHPGGCRCSLCGEGMCPPPVGDSSDQLQQDLEQQMGGGAASESATGAAGGTPADGAPAAPAPATDGATQAVAQDMHAELDAALRAAPTPKAELFVAPGGLNAGTIGVGTPGDFPDTLAFVTPPWSGAGGTYGYPDLNFEETVQTMAPGEYGPPQMAVKIRPTTSTDAMNPCIVPGVGDIKWAGANPTESRTVAGTAVTLDKYIRLDQAWHDRIAASEQEHLDDLVLAYQLSLAAAATAVNALAGQEFLGATIDQAKTRAKEALAGRLHAKLTATAATWRTVVMSLGRLSGSQRDARGTHSYGLTYNSVDATAKKVFYTINAGTSRAIAPANVVKFDSI